MRVPRPLWWLTALAAAAWLSFLGRVPLFDWDEMNFAEIAREMLALGDWTRVHVNYELFWEKPPLFFWLQAAAMKLFGVGAFAARLPNALIGLANLWVLYAIGSRLEDRRLGLYWALAWFGSLLPHFYAKSGLIDPLFNLGMLLGLYGFLLGAWRLEGLPASGEHAPPAPASRALSPATGTRPLAFPRSPAVAFAGGGLAIGAAVLAKGPVGLLLPGLTLAALALRHGWWRARRRPFAFAGGGLLWIGVALAACGAWFAVDWARNGPWFTESFLAYQWRLFRTEDAGHGGFPGYHPVVLLLGCFPASILALAALRRHALIGRRAQAWREALLVLLIVVLVVFGLVQSKIVHYSSLAYYPITFLAATRLHAWHRRADGPGRGTLFALGAVAGLWSLAAVGFVLVSRNPEWVAPLLRQPFAAGQWSLLEPLAWTRALPALVLPVALLGAGFAFRRNATPTGAAFLFLGSALFLQAGLWCWIRPAERLAQGPVVRWWTEIGQQDAYTWSAFRSYAPFFYGRPDPPAGYDPAKAAQRAQADRADGGKHGFHRRRETDRNWLLWGHDVDKPVWIVAKEGSQAAWIEALPEVERIRAEGGYVLLRRLPPALAR